VRDFVSKKHCFPFSVANERIKYKQHLLETPQIPAIRNVLLKKKKHTKRSYCKSFEIQ